MGRGGKRPGAGKPKGYKHARTLEKEAAREHYHNRIVAELDPLIDAQLDLAKGYQTMWARAFEKDPKSGQRRRTGKWERVTVAAEIAQLLNDGDAGEDYYRIYTKDPDARMNDILMNRRFDPPKSRVEIEGQPLVPLFQLPAGVRPAVHTTT